AGTTTRTPHFGQIAFLPLRNALTCSLCPLGHKNLMPILVPMRIERRAAAAPSALPASALFWRGTRNQPPEVLYYSLGKTGIGSWPSLAGAAILAKKICNPMLRGRGNGII